MTIKQSLPCCSTCKLLTFHWHRLESSFMLMILLSQHNTRTFQKSEKCEKPHLLMRDVDQFGTNSRNCQFLWSHWSVIVLWISFVLFYTISKLFPLKFTPLNMSLFTPFSPYMLKRAILLLTCKNWLMSSQRCIPFLLFELLTFLLTRITN